MRSRVLSFTIAFTAILVTAQQPSKRPLTLTDADRWRSITNQVLSRDGKLLAYAMFPQEGDGELVVRDLATGREQHDSLGALPPPPDPNAAEVPEQQPARVQGVRIVFTPDDRYVISTTHPSKADIDQAKKQHKRPAEMPKGGLLILPVGTGAGVHIANVKSVQVPERGDSFAVYLKEAPPAAEGASVTDQRRGAARPKYGSDLVIRDLRTPDAAERTFPDVIEYALTKDGGTLVYAVASKKEETNGMYAVSPLGSAAPVALLAGKGKYAKPAWDRAQNQLAFLAAREDSRFHLYLWDRKSVAPAELAGPATAGLRDGFVLYDRGVLNFSRDGSRVFVAVATTATTARAAETEREPATAAPSDDKVVADLWRWNDDYVQPMQKVRAPQERTRSYTAVVHLAEKRFVQLGDPTMAGLIRSEDGRYAIATDDRPFRSMVDYDANYANYYLVDTLTGDRKLLMEKFRAGGIGGPAVSWSPDGKYVLTFRNGQWHTISIPGGVDTDLTGKLGVKFWNEDHDSPGPAPAYGNGGWTRDDKILVYDRYDVWEIPADGQSPRNLTAGAGRGDNLQFRAVRLDRGDPDEAALGIDPVKPLLLRAENLETRDTGIFETRLDREAPPRKLVMGPRSYHPIIEAHDADVIVATASTFHDEPDLLVTDSSFRELRKVTNMNPQKEQILWGTGELFRYTTTDGISLEAALYKPENFDPQKKYPMLVYLYERLSQNVNTFIPPRPGTSINIPEYVSNGYLVLTPDIVYTVGAPGPSALKCVLPAVQAVVNRGFVDENAIGIQGHSWGGYQVAYMITQTDRFRAAEAGAPVADMISAYNGIRWGTGLPRQFQYEQTQSRIGGTPWQYPLRFIENSPVFHVDRVRTPVLILHDDADDAVPWYQGIELFLSLRRLGKEAYLFDYNGEAHGLRKRPNQKDYTVRMRQFFDHFLKGAPAPEWMANGIPYVDREQRFNSGTEVPRGLKSTLHN